MIVTYQYRLKDATIKGRLSRLASKVNFVWNYLNETSSFAWKRDRRWLSEFDFNYLMSGSSTELGLHSASIQSVSNEFVTKRNKARTSRLSWRSAKRKLGWIPFKSSAVSIDNDTVIFQKKKYRFWKSRDIEGKIKTGSFNQNSKGQWFVNFQCEIPLKKQTKAKKFVGIDLGLKTLATMSDGNKIENPKTLQKHAERLAKAQMANKKKLTKSIYAKIKNIRKDFLHKESTKLVNNYKKIFVGNVSSSQLVKTKMAKSVLDAGWGTFKSMLEYKANWLGVDFKVVNEKYSSVTCSSCFEKSGPSGLSALGVRIWECKKCDTSHDRDVNAAQNILRFGLGH